jgi:hypothetical protein
LCGADTWDTPKTIPEIPAKFWIVVLEKDGEDQMDRSCKKLRVTYNEREKKDLRYNASKER